MQKSRSVDCKDEVSAGVVFLSTSMIVVGKDLAFTFPSEECVFYTIPLERDDYSSDYLLRKVDCTQDHEQMPIMASQVN